MAELLNPIDEARRYIENAREMLKTKGSLFDGIYLDRKYVRTAGHTAWSGVLYAMEAIMKVKASKKPKRVEYYDYLEAIPKGEKIIIYFKSAYSTLHLAMGYDGNPDKEVIDAGIKRANEIIDWCAAHYTPPKPEHKKAGAQSWQSFKNNIRAIF
jgi:hypothetical protein